MALSTVSWRGETDGFQEFDAHVGSSRYYAWAVGSGVQRRDGIPMLSTRSTTSPLLGPLPAGSRGRLVLRVPSDAFTRDDHHLQLLSFRDEELRGPAASDVVEVPWRWSRPDREEPAMSMAQATTTWSELPAPRTHPGAAHLRPAQPEPLCTGRLPGSPRMSEAQFLGALGGLISQVLPFVQRALPIVQEALPVVGEIAGALAPPAPAAAGAPGAAGAGSQPAAKPDLGVLLAKLLGQVQRLTSPEAAPPAAAPTSSAAVTPVQPAAASHAVQASLVRAASRARYSEAQIAPLLAALPALAPLLQNVLTPQTVQSLISAADPNRLLQTTFAGLMDAAKIGQQATDALHAHLRALNPGTGDDVLIPLLASMSTGASVDSAAPRHRRSRLVTLEVPDLAPVELQGFPQVAFQWGEDVTIPVAVHTPRPIRRARLQVCVKDVASQAVVAERTTRHAAVEDGRLDPPVQLPGAVTRRLRPGREYLVCLRLLWPSKDGLMGTTTAQLVRFVGAAVFDSVDTGGRPVRLDDVDRDRDWWHQVWADTVEERSNRVRARLDYEYRLSGSEPRSGGGPGNRRRQTRVDLDPVTGRRSEGRLRAGLDVSIESLSRLAQRLDADPFDDDTLRALDDPAFRAVFDRTAGCEVSLHGRRHSRMAVWVWPEVKLHDVFLRTPGQVSSTTGQVLSFETRPVTVPIPALAHVLTTRSS